MKVHVSLDNQSMSGKPNRTMYGAMRRRIAERWMEIEVEELAELVGNQGYAMIPAKLVGGISQENCQAMELFTLDFDKGVSFKKIDERCKEFGLPILFAYHTFSSTPENERFRVVFALDDIIHDAFSIKVVMVMFHRIFRGCDSQCKNLDRVFLGGKDLICTNPEARIAFLHLLHIFYGELDKGGHFKGNIRQFCIENKIGMTNGRAKIYPIGMEAQNCEKSDLTIIHIIVESQKSRFVVIEDNKIVHQSNTRRNYKKRRLDFKNGTACNLLAEFYQGRELSHGEKFGLFTNLMHIVEGQDFFLNVLKENEPDSYKKWNKDKKYMKGYHPQRCSSDFCPYYDSCDNAGTIVETLAMERRVYVEEEIYHPESEATAQMERNLEEALSSSKEGLHLIKAQTALGKTTAYINLIMKHPEKNFLVAVPTNILKRQVFKDIEIRTGEKVFMTASVSDTLIPTEIREKVKEYHQNGLHNHTKQIVKEYLNEIKDNPDMTAVVKECEKILGGVELIEDERVVVTTHAYLEQMPLSFLEKYIIIIDEDILQLDFLAKCYSVSLQTLKRMVELQETGELEVPSAYLSVAKEILDTEDNLYRNSSINSTLQYTEKMNDAFQTFCCGGEENLGDLVRATTFVKWRNQEHDETMVHYFCPGFLQKMKYIVLSATLNAEVYRTYFKKVKNPMDIFVYEEKKAKYTGKLIQYTYHSLGRKDLAKKLQVFDIAKELANESIYGFITYQTFPGKDKVTNHNFLPLHFGNTMGINEYKGKNIGIVGTFYKIEPAYKLVACYLGANVNQEADKNPRPRRVNYKGRSFLITTYAEPLLQEIQLYAIESEMEQCVGRARLLREDCTVYLFSAFPCEQAEIHIQNYLA